MAKHFVASVFSLILLASACGANMSAKVSDFRYSSISDAHMGGDNFDRRTVRVDLGDNRVEMATVTAAGVLRSLTRHSASAGPSLALPQEPADNADPFELSSGMGPTAVVAAGTHIARIDVREVENKTAGATEVTAAFAAFDRALRARAGRRDGQAQPGQYWQLRALPQGAASNRAINLNGRTIEQNPVLKTLFEKPFAFHRVGAVEENAQVAPELQLEKGRSHLVTWRGRLFAITRYDLGK
ncbi:MAG: hypothetical protein AAFQ19_14060 [Pseudomonadota bacterium]